MLLAVAFTEGCEVDLYLHGSFCPTDHRFCTAVKLFLFPFSSERKCHFEKLVGPCLVCGT